MDISQAILSDITVFQKYSKFIPEIHRRETWDELIDRNQAMHTRRYPQLKDKIRQVYRDFVRPKKVLPSMRSLQFAGAPIEISNVRIFNCAYMPIDHPFAFAELMFLLLSGTGVGYSVQNRHISKLPVIQGPAAKTRRFLVGDSIEGWADAVKVLIKAYTSGKSDPVFDYRDIRPKGAALITSGGKAPGPDPLRICIDEIRSKLNGALGRRLTSLEVHDIACHIADAVLAGGIRRAAMIAMFDRDDLDMLSCKSGAWYELNPQRGRANNSAVLPRGEVTQEEFFDLWERVKNSGSGEPGFYWSNNLDWGANPCVSGDSLITVCDHGIKNTSVGVTYKIPLRMLVELVNSTDMPPLALSYNEKTGEREFKEITAAALTKQLTEVVEVEYEGRVLKCTPDHKILTRDRGWIEAQNLLETDVLILE